MKKLSIILPVRNGLSYTRQCIEILRGYALPSCEYIVIDNESADGTRKWLTAQSNIKVVQGSASWSLARAFNEGRKKARGELLLFLHNDTVCSRDAIPALIKVVEMEGVAAAGPLTNRCMHYKQFVEPDAYQSPDEMQAFASKLSHGGEKISVNVCLFLESFCMMVRARAFDEVGGFDERFNGVGYEDVDFSFRLLQAGYWLCIASVYVHHGEGSFEINRLSREKTYGETNQAFQAKWGIDLSYSAGIRYDLLKYMDISRPDISVLEIGCALGGNLMCIKWNNPSASLFGFELNPSSVAIAKNFGNVKVANAENMDYEEFRGKFDYVMAGDLIEHLRDPWSFVKKMKEVLKPGGKFLASIPNVAHISNVYGLLHGFWNYTDEGLLDRTHLRFFTRNTIFEMFQDAGFRIEECSYNTVALPESMHSLLDTLTKIPEFPVSRDNLEAFQIFVKAGLKE